MSAFLLGVPGKLKTLMDRLTAGRAAKLDNLDASVSSRAPSATALSNLTLTNGRAAKLDDIIQTSVIKSIQTGYVSAIGVSSTGEDTRYLDVTISSVDTSKCIVIIHPVGNYMDTGRLTSATNLRLTGSASTTVRGRWYVIEFK
jgi:hypothetical protein